MAEWQLPAELVSWITDLSGTLQVRVAGRLLPLFLGMLFAQGRKTVASWLRAVGVGEDFRLYYYFLSSVGRKSKWIGAKLLRIALSVIVPGDRLLFALDDTPTKRAGPLVEGAGIHHNPTPGAADQKFLYGHIWVTLSLVVRHPVWGTIGLPLLALMYIRRKDIGKLPPWYKVLFRTKLIMAVDLLTWVIPWVKSLGKKLCVVADGAYAKRAFLKGAKELGFVVFSRLRKDAALWSVPPTPQPGERKPRGRPAIYGKERIRLAEQAAHKAGWLTGIFTLYGKKVTKTYKTFVATYQPAGGPIRVVLVQEDNGWVAYFCTDPDATVQEILEAVADRGAIEQNFHDIKEVHGTGQQQVRNYWANVGVYHMNMWWYTLVELWAWNKPHEQLCDRSDRPWDDPTRRPSHADRCSALRRQCIESAFAELHARSPITAKFRSLFRRVVKLTT